MLKDIARAHPYMTRRASSVQAVPAPGGHSIKIYGMTTFDELMPEIFSISSAEPLHAKFYLHELNFMPSGVSVVALSVKDTPERSIFSGP